MDEIQNNPNVPDDVKAAISGAMSLTLEEEDAPMEGDAVHVNEEDEFGSYDEEFNLSEAERKSKKSKRRHQTDDEMNDDDGDWLSSRGKRKKKSKKRKAKKEKKKREKERKRKEKQKTELEGEAAGGGTDGMGVDLVEKPKKSRRKRKSADGADLVLNTSIENGNESIDCDKKVKREKRPRAHKVRIPKVPSIAAHIDATIEAVVNGHGEPDDDGDCAGTTIEMKIEVAENVIARVADEPDADDGYNSSAVNASASSSNNTLSMGKVDNSGLNQCASLMKLASETTNTKKKKTATSKSESNAKRKLQFFFLPICYCIHFIEYLALNMNVYRLDSV